VTAPWVRPAELVELTSRFLDAVYSEERGLYPFTTSVVDGRYVSDYGPGAVRYSINTLLGRFATAADSGQLTQQLERLRSEHGSTLGAGDSGLMLVLLAETGAPDLQSALATAQAALEREGLARTNLQDLSWLAWGAARAAEAGVEGAEPFAHELREGLRALAGPGALASHTRSRARKDLVSFGSTVYYLRALHELGRVFDDAEATTAFEHGVRTALGFQGPRGEWPWLISVSRGHALDVYPVYSVHQLAMAMLFLLPALDDGAVEGIEQAIKRSVRWVAGENELGVEFGQREPFIVFRSLERAEPLPKLARVARAGANSALGRATPETPARRTRINREWRSYEGGWLLYAWADRELEI
jgi:hypothetical protein